MIFCICPKLFRSSIYLVKFSLPLQISKRANEGRHFIRIKLITLHRCVIAKFFVQTNKLLSHTFEGFCTWQNQDPGWDTLYKQFFIFFLRVSAPKTDGVYYRGCRRPEPDFDEIRSRRSFWAKTKFETPLSAIQAHRRGLRASKVGHFLPPKKSVFWPNFFSLKP